MGGKPPPLPKLVLVLGTWSPPARLYKTLRCGCCIIVVLFFVHKMRSKPNGFPPFLGKCSKAQFHVP